MPSALNATRELSPPLPHEAGGVGDEIRGQQKSDARRSANQKLRLDDFRANNFNSANTPAPGTHVTHVLCCPACQFMTLQEEALAMHAASLHAIARLSVHRCALCQAACTQRDIMMEHISIYHGLLKESEILPHLVTSSVQCLAASSAIQPPVISHLTGSKKRKSTIPERIQHQQQLSPLATVDADASEATKRCRTGPADPPSPLDLSLRTQETPQGRQHQQQQEKQTIPQSAEEIAAAASAAKDSTFSQDEAEAEAVPQQRRGHHHQHQQHRQHRAKPQRQNFTDAQNRQLQVWFTEHRGKPYPSTADTKRLAELTGLNYSQVKKWFANRRMRTKTPVTDEAAATQLAGKEQAADSEHSSGKATPSSQWSVSDFRIESSPGLVTPKLE